MRRPMLSCRSRARACTRSRSARCMPASSSPAISASPPTARPWCGWRSGSATSTRASSGLMRGADIAPAARLAGRASGDSTVAYAFAFARAVEAALGIEAPARATVAARADGRAGAPRQPSRRHRRDLQRRRLRADARPLRRPARARAARRRRLLRPPADDGPDRARRRRGRPRPPTARRRCAP